MAENVEIALEDGWYMYPRRPKNKKSTKTCEKKIFSKTFKLGKSLSLKVQDLDWVPTIAFCRRDKMIFLNQCEWHDLCHIIDKISEEMRTCLKHLES